MAVLLRGAETAGALSEALRRRTEELKARGSVPCLAIVRVGQREDDLAYERGAVKRCEAIGIAARRITFPGDVAQQTLIAALRDLGADGTVHGILLFRPLPPQLDDAAVRRAIVPEKDVDGVTDASMAALYAGTGQGFPPCTAEACVELLKHGGVSLAGRRVTVVGRSLVIGKPVALLLLAENATVTVCHSKSRDLPALCREADILIVAAGKAGLVGAESVRSGQTVVDVGIHTDENGRLCGDVRFSEAESVAAAITPVPGGVGAVTSTILAAHVVRAAEALTAR